MLLVSENDFRIMSARTIALPGRLYRLCVHLIECCLKVVENFCKRARQSISTGNKDVIEALPPTIFHDRFRGFAEPAFHTVSFDSPTDFPCGCKTNAQWPDVLVAPARLQNKPGHRPAPPLGGL